MQGIHRLHPRSLKFLRTQANVFVQIDTQRRPIRPGGDLELPVNESASPDFEIKDFRPRVLDLPSSHLPLNGQLRQRLNHDLRLLLIVKRPVVATIVKIYAHVLLLSIP